MKTTLLSVIILLCATAARSQNLSEMPEAERNKLLLGAAKEAVRKYAPDYVKYISGEYKIRFISAKIDDSGLYKSLFVVQFVEYDKEEEYFRERYAVCVEFLADNGELWCVGDGDGIGILVQSPLSLEEKIKLLRYEGRPPHKPRKARSDGKIWSD